ncbi:MAG: V-type ATP synthase subunit F [Pseudomonadota bacterium]|nr:V-type ATP synthase subunit F [Pseudomonadota bacterium]
MRPPWFIGDEVTATGFRLAGFRTATPPPGDELSVLRQTCSEADLVLISAEIANRVPKLERERMQRASRPLLLVIPDVRGRHSAPDLGAGLRRQLGLAE